jgi:hypothetical protein
MNLLPRHRIQIPNGLAVFAALLLLVSSVVGYETNQEVNSSAQEPMTSTKIDQGENSPANDTVEHKSRGLKLGLLLFRRG